MLLGMASPSPIPGGVTPTAPAAPPERGPSAAVWAATILYVVASLVAFFVLWDNAMTDDFAGWVPAGFALQAVWVALVGITPRASPRVTAATGIAAGIAGVFVLVCGTLSLWAPLEVLETHHEDLAMALGVVALGVAFASSVVVVVRFARDLAKATARGVTAVLLTVGLTGLWAIASGATSYASIEHRPGAFLQGIVSYGAMAAGVLAIGFVVPLSLHVLWLSARWGRRPR